MMHRAHTEFGLRTLVRTFAAALVVLALTSCGGGDPFGGDNLVAVRFVTQPVSTTAGAPFSVSVELLTTGNVRATSSSAPVTIGIAGGGSIAGTTTVVAVSGLATFSGLTVDSAATGLMLSASRGALVAQSTAFDVTAGPPAQSATTLVFQGQVNPSIPVTATLTVRDEFQNPIAGAAVSLATSVGGTAFAPSSGTTTADGVFASSVNFGTTGAGTLTATVGAASFPFPVDPEICIIGAIAIDTALAGTVSAASTNGCRLHNHPSSINRFSVPADPNAMMVAISATGTGTFFPELAITPDPRTTTGTIFYSNSTSSLASGPYEWLVPSGNSFLAHISSANGNGGSYSLTVANHGLGAPGCFGPGSPSNRLLLGMNATYAGQALANTDCVVSDGGQQFYTDYFFLFDNRPCTISMTAAYGVYIQADDNDGTNIDFADTPNLTGSLSLSSCQSQGFPIAISFSSHDPLITGAYSFQFAFTGAALRASGPVSPGPEVSIKRSGVPSRARVRK